jgi:hypothetical protein
MTEAEQIREIEKLVAQSQTQTALLQKRVDAFEDAQKKTLERLHALGVKLIESGPNLELPPDSPSYMSTTAALELIKKTYGKAMHDVLMALFKDDFSFLERALEETVIQWREPTQAEIAAEMWLDEQDLAEC